MPCPYLRFPLLPYQVQDSFVSHSFCSTNNQHLNPEPWSRLGHGLINLTVTVLSSGL